MYCNTLEEYQTYREENQVLEMVLGDWEPITDQLPMLICPKCEFDLFFGWAEIKVHLAFHFPPFFLVNGVPATEAPEVMPGVPDINPDDEIESAAPIPIYLLVDMCCRMLRRDD